MRFLQSHVVALANGVPAATRSITARPLQRSLHQTSIAFRPRQRTFFTTNDRLAKDGSSKDDASVGTPAAATPAIKDSHKDHKADHAQPQQPQQSSSGGSKRKGKRTAPNKKLRDPLRRVASIAQRASRKPQQATKDGDSIPGKDYAQTICAFCVAESFDMKEVVRALHGQHYIIDPDGMGFDEDEIVHARVHDMREGDYYVFASGTVVTWSLPPEKGVYVARDLLHNAKERAHDGDIEIDILTEKLEFETDPTTSTNSMRGDTVVLGTKPDAAHGSEPTDTGRAKIAFSSGLARSTKVAVLETLLEEFLEATEEYPEQLVRGGKLLVDMPAILQRTGEILQLRAQLNFFSELTDSLPDKFWDQRAELKLDSIYDQVGKALDVPSRIRVLNQRMDYADAMLETFRGMLQAKHEVKLETVIIYLIAIEVFFQFINWWREYRTKTNAEGRTASFMDFGAWVWGLD